MNKKDCNTVIRIKTYDEIARTQKRAEKFKVCAVESANIPSGQKIKVKQIDTKRPRLNKKIVVAVTTVLVVALAVPFFFAVASNANQVSGLQPVSGPSAGGADTAVASVAPVPAATGGQLTTDLMEKTTIAVPDTAPSPVPIANVLPAAAMTPLTAESGFTELSSGMSDPFVAMIQQRLMDLFYVEQDELTTLFGPVTKQAVVDFQKRNGLPETGVADVQTQSILFSAAANPYIVRLGDSSPDVQSIQERLTELGYAVEISGTYGDDTQKAVQTFQMLNSLSADGNVGNDTRRALYSRDARDASATPQPGKATASSQPNTPADPNKVEAFINAAMAQLGKTYVLGGKGPNIFDCSGLVYYSLKASGNGIGYMTSYGWADADEYQRIGSMKDLQRGDVVCVSGHVGVYLGNGQVVNASSSNGNVIVSQDIFSSNYWRGNFICGRRPF